MHVINKLLGRPGGEKSMPDLNRLLSEAYTLLKSKDYSKAREILLRAVAFRGRVSDAATIKWILESLEATWLLQDLYEEQIKFFSDHITCFPGDVAAYSGRAAGHWYSAQLHDAVRDYTRALELDPTDILSRSGRGQVLAELGESARGMEDLDATLRSLLEVPKSVADQPQWYKEVEAFVRRGRGIALAQMGQMQEALNEIEESVTLSPENAWVYYSRAQIYERLGERENALADYQAALTKLAPHLTRYQKEHAQERVLSLSRDGLS